MPQQAEAVRHPRLGSQSPSVSKLTVLADAPKTRGGLGACHVVGAPTPSTLSGPCAVGQRRPRAVAMQHGPRLRKRAGRPSSPAWSASSHRVHTCSSPSTTPGLASTRPSRRRHVGDQGSWLPRCRSGGASTSHGRAPASEAGTLSRVRRSTERRTRLSVRVAALPTDRGATLPSAQVSHRAEPHWRRP